VFTPFENLCIDESLTLFKGWLSFIQHIPSKRHRIGEKISLLSVIVRQAMFWISLYTWGATTEIEPGREFGVSGAVATTLMEKYLQKGHTLWMDNWYSSPQLYDNLHKNKTDICGTVRRNKKGILNFKKKN
jgi:hypothetical protein